MCPGWNDAGEIIIATCVGIHIRLHVHAAAARIFDECDNLPHASPILLIRDLEMQNIHRDMRPLGNGDSFFDRIEHTQTFIADVRRVNSAVLAYDAAKFNYVIHGRQRSRRHHDLAGQPESAFLHCFGHKPLHFLDVCDAGAREGLSHHRLPDVPNPDVGRNVHGNSSLFPGLEIFTQATNH